MSKWAPENPSDAGMRCSQGAAPARRFGTSAIGDHLLWVILFRLEEARGLELHQKLFGAANARTALAMISLGEMYVSAGKTEEGKRYYRDGILTLEAALGEEVPILERARSRYRKIPEAGLLK